MTALPNRIQAIEFPALGEVSLVSHPFPPAPGPDEVLLRPDYLGICGTDLHVLHGKHPWVRPPVQTGHEVVARVVAVGTAVTRFRPGQRVVVNPLVTCGTCRACDAGQPNHCESAKVMGFRLPGVASTYLNVPAAQLHAVPDGLAPTLAALAEPLAVGIHAVGRARDLHKVLIIGGGTIGLCVLLAARLAGAGPIDIVEPVAAKRALALRLGAQAAHAPEVLSGLGGYSAVFDCVAAQATLDEACRATAGGGTMAVVGVADAARALPLPRLQRFEIDVLGSGMYVPADIDAAIAALAAGEIEAGALISAIRPLAEAKDAYEQAGQRDSVKVLIDMG